MTLQEIFDTTARHLLRQRERSINEKGVCMYLSPTGFKCAVGALITEQAYTQGIEGLSVRRIDAQKIDDRTAPLAVALIASGIDIYDAQTLELLSDLQTLHDSYTPQWWREQLIALAQTHGLDPVAVTMR